MEAQTEVAGEIPVYLRGNCQGALQPDVAVKASIILTSPRVYCICKVEVGDIAKIYTEVFLFISGGDGTIPQYWQRSRTYPRKNKKYILTDVFHVCQWKTTNQSLPWFPPPNSLT